MKQPLSLHPAQQQPSRPVGEGWGEGTHQRSRPPSSAALSAKLRPICGLGLLLLALLLSGCAEDSWNNPYASHNDEKVLYSSFSSRPKHLDPVRSYSSDEFAFIAQIYEPPLQYHFLHRPYQLVPLTASELPEVRYLDQQGQPLADNSDHEAVAFSEYHIRIQPGVAYQPHPALALDEQGQPRYHQLSPADIASRHTLADFPHTGTRELVAADYVHQIKRIGFAALHSPIRGLMSDYIIGLKDFTSATSAAWEEQQQDPNPSPFFDLRNHEMEGLRVIDRYHYAIRLKGEYPQFIYWLAMPFFAPMPWEAEAFYHQPGMKARNITLDWYPLGTGPFMLTENNPNLRMVLEANPHFHPESYPHSGEPQDAQQGLLEDAGRPLPLINKAIYSLEKESIPRWNKFLQGWYDASGIGSDSFDQAVQFSGGGNASLTPEMEQRGIQLVTEVETSIFYLGFNMQDPVVGGDGERERLLRRAISIAVDFEEYISIFLNGRGVAAQGPLPPGIFGHHGDETEVNPYIYRPSDQGPRRRSIDEARELLVEAGYPAGRDSASGKALVLHYDTTATGPDDKARLNWMRKQLAKLGIELVIRATDYNRFQEKMRKGTAQLYMWGWNADYPDPENFFFLLYGPNSKATSGGENASNYSNPEFDALFDRMKNLPNGPQRLELIDQMQEILRQDAPWSWGFFPKAFSLHHAWYGNVKPNLMANNTLKYKRIDHRLRQEQRSAWNRPIVWPLVLGLVVLVLSSLPAWLVYRRRERSSAR